LSKKKILKDDRKIISLRRNYKKIKDMEAAVVDLETTAVNVPFNDTQIFLLQAFARIKSEEEKTDIQAMLLDYYRKRVDFHANEISFSNEKIEEILNSHYRTPYK